MTKLGSKTCYKYYHAPVSDNSQFEIVPSVHFYFLESRVGGGICISSAPGVSGDLKDDIFLT